MKRYFLTSACTLATIALSAGIPMTANAQDSGKRDKDSSAQQDSRRDRSDRDQRDRDQRDRDSDRLNRDQRERDRNQQDWQQSDRRARSDQDQRQGDRRSDQSSVRVMPQGWIHMGADYDNDGRFEAIETIYLLDLQQAQERSKARARADQQRSQTDRYRSERRPMSESRRMRRDDSRRSQRDFRRDQTDSRSDRRIAELRGEITRTKTGKLAGKDQSYVMAHLDTRSGNRVCAVLGPQNKLKDWDLQEGDRIQLRGVRARLNDRKVIMADRVSHDGNSVKVDLPSPQRLKRAKGEILDMRTVRFKGHDESFVVAQVETPNDKKRLVNLGPKSNLKKLKLEKGDEVRILARPGKISGRQAMIAQEIVAGDRRVDVPRPEDTRRFRQRNQNRDRS